MQACTRQASAAAHAKLQDAGSGSFSRACLLPGLNARDSASREPLCGVLTYHVPAVFSCFSVVSALLLRVVNRTSLLQVPELLLANSRKDAAGGSGAASPTTLQSPQEPGSPVSSSVSSPVSSPVTSSPSRQRQQRQRQQQRRQQHRQNSSLAVSAGADVAASAAAAATMAAAAAGAAATDMAAAPGAQQQQGTAARRSGGVVAELLIPEWEAKTQVTAASLPAAPPAGNASQAWAGFAPQPLPRGMSSVRRFTAPAISRRSGGGAVAGGVGSDAAAAHPIFVPESSSPTAAAEADSLHGSWARSSARAGDSSAAAAASPAAEPAPAAATVPASLASAAPANALPAIPADAAPQRGTHVVEHRLSASAATPPAPNPYATFLDIAGAPQPQAPLPVPPQAPPPMHLQAPSRSQPLLAPGAAALPALPEHPTGSAEPGRRSASRLSVSSRSSSVSRGSVSRGSVSRGSVSRGSMGGSSLAAAPGIAAAMARRAPLEASPNPYADIITATARTAPPEASPNPYAEFLAPPPQPTMVALSASPLAPAPAAAEFVGDAVTAGEAAAPGQVKARQLAEQAEATSALLASAAAYKASRTATPAR